MKCLIVPALVLSLFLSSKVMAQQEEQTTPAATSQYKDALGIRLGPSTPAIQNGFTYRHFIKDDRAIEGILSIGNGIGICGLYEVFKPLTVQDVSWFFGGGGYVAFPSGTYNVGAAGIIGLDYKFPAFPLNISVDWKPELNLVSKTAFEAATVGFSARFVFK